MSELVQDVQHAVLPAVVGSVFDEVVRPNVIGPLGPQTDAGSVAEPQPTALRLFGRDFKPLASPDPFDPLVVDHPTGGRTQQLGDLPIAVAPILSGKFDDVGGEPLLVVSAASDVALGRSVLPEHPADPALGHLHHRPDVVDTGAATRRA